MNCFSILSLFIGNLLVSSIGRFLEKSEEAKKGYRFQRNCSPVFSIRVRGW